MAARLSVYILLIVLASGCSVTRSKHVSLPPTNASPQRVVTTYVAALNAHDVGTARALLTPAHARLVETEADSWFTNVESITNLQVDRPTIDRSDPRAARAIVGVHFVLNQHNVTSMPDGPTVWGYMLIRHGPKQRWLIYDEGIG